MLFQGAHIKDRKILPILYNAEKKHGTHFEYSSDETVNDHPFPVVRYGRVFLCHHNTKVVYFSLVNIKSTKNECRFVL